MEASQMVATIKKNLAKMPGFCLLAALSQQTQSKCSKE